MKNYNFSTGGNRRDAYRIARALGCNIYHVRRTGEDRITHPIMNHSVKVDARRKDCPIHLTVYLKRINEQTDEATKNAKKGKKKRQNTA